MNSKSTGKPSSLNIYIGTFFIAFSTLALEVTLSRLLSVITYYHLAFFAISTAMLGMTAGAVTVYLKPHWFMKNNINSNTAKACLAYSVAVAVMLFFICIIPVKNEFSAMKIFGLLGITFACSLPFYFSGMVVSVVLTKYELPIGKLYSSDLIGASMGCLLVLGGLEIFDASGLILLCSSIGIISVFSFDYKQNSMKSRWGGLLVLILLLSGTLFNLFVSNTIRPMYVKGKPEKKSDIIYEKWNSFSRVVVGNGVVGRPIWGCSPVIPESYKNFYYPMNIDGDAATAVSTFNKLEDILFLRYDMTNVAYYLRENGESACIIGLGGGRDVQSAIVFGYKNITGIDVNPVFVDLHKNKFRNVSNIADRNGIRLVVDEARSYLSHSDEKYTLIQMSLIDTWASTGAGSFTFTENSLYTLEAWEVVLGHLKENGMFVVSRWFSPNNLGETGRSVSLAVDALLHLGSQDPSKNIALLTIGGISSLIISKNPFTQEDINKLKEVTSKLEFNLAIIPGISPSNDILRNIVASKSEDQLINVIKNEPLNYYPTTDNNPYFFNMLKLSHLTEARSSEIGVIHGNLIASVYLIILIFSLLLFTVLTIIFPLLLNKRNKKLNITKHSIFWSGAFYFSFIGAGFMMIEIALMQRFSIYLGHPVYALGILLFSIILSSGIGSYFSDRFNIALTSMKFVLPAVTAVIIFSLNFILDIIISGTITSSILYKIMITIIVIFPLGLLLGFFFPTGMKLVKSQSKDETPWFWALNGIFGVLFSAIAVFLSIYFGISTNFYLASICYAGTLFIIGSLSKAKEV